MKNIVKIKLGSFLRLSSGETGSAFIIVLIFLILGSLTLVPTLAHIGTALKTGEIYEEKTNETYAADSGIEDGLWRIKYDFMGIDYDPYDYDAEWSYLTDEINGITASFTIKNLWFCDVTLGDVWLTSQTAKEMIDSNKLIVTGTAGTIPGNPYNVRIDFTPDVGDNLTVKSLGVWLPQGFEYVPDSCSLQDDGPSTVYYPDSTENLSVPGGTTVVWSYYDYPLFTDFPGVDSMATPMILNFTFSYTPPAEHPNWMPTAVAWITTDMNPPNTNDVPLSWDVDTRFYKIVSTAGDTTIEAYASKKELRQMGDAMSGDYVAIGNSLLADNDGDNLRDDDITDSFFNLNDPTDNVSIPEDADVVAAYLYWSGWRNDAAKVNISPFPDTCDTFDNWERVNQFRKPTNDSSISGTWSITDPVPPITTKYCDQVDELPGYPAIDTDYITGTTDAGGYILFTFDPFSIPDDSVIANLTIHVKARDANNGGNNLYARLKVSGTYYDSASWDPLGTSFSSHSYSFSTNPATGSAWTIDDIKGTGSKPLQEFGVYSTDLNPDIRVSMVCAEVDCSSCWTLSTSPSPRFQGRGNSSATDQQRSLTLINSLDLSAYTPSTVVVYWDQTESGDLEATDALYFAFSGDGGSNWSDDIEAFHDDNPSSPFWYPVPEDYLTSNFLLRFRVDFNDAAEYVYLDNIKVIYMTPDTEITFMIDDEQVYFNGSAAAKGSQPLIAGRSYAMFNSMWGVPEGYSYACVRDVTELVQTFTEESHEGNHTGNAEYTVDDVSADKYKSGMTLSNFAFAGWSLIIVYAAPETAGHYIYLRDNNFAFHPGTGGNIDWDQDGEDGGIITDFKIPEPIKDKQGNIRFPVAAKITAFVVEGDDFGTSSIVITAVSGERTCPSMSLWNTESPFPDVWNGESYPGTFEEGVDIDTFEVKWDDEVGGNPVLMPKDDKLQVDLFSNGDAWNLVYFIISIQSETSTSGTTHYVIHGG